MTNKTMTELSGMTHEELVQHAITLQTILQNDVFSLTRDDVQYALSGVLSLPEEFISDDLIDVAEREMKGRFGFDNESEQIMNFLTALPINWSETEGNYSGQMMPDGTLFIWFKNEAVDGSPDLHLQSENEVDNFLTYLFGEDWENVMERSPSFQFQRKQLTDF